MFSVPVRITQGDFPGGPVVGNAPANAGNTGFIPGLGGSHMPRGTKPVHHSYCTHAPRAHALQHEKPPQSEANTPQLESSPRSQQLEKAPA